MLAVGLHPSVVRAAIAAALGSLAWLVGRERDRWHALLVGAAALLAWNPYLVLDAGFQLSFAAVASIFLVAPRVVRVARRLSGAALARRLIARLDRVRARDGAGDLVPVPPGPARHRAGERARRPGRRADARPRARDRGARAGRAARSRRRSPGANGWGAGYLAACARFFGGLPGAQVTLAAGGRRARGGRPPRRCLCLASMAETS